MSKGSKKIYEINSYDYNKQKESLAFKKVEKADTIKDDIIDVVLDLDVLGQLGYYLYVRKIDSTIIKITKNGEIINSLYIPSTYKYDNIQYRITKIDDELFKNCDVLEEITIPNSVIKIGKRAFWNCTKLVKVKNANNVMEIGDCAFLDCEQLSEIELNENVKLGRSSFKDCKSLSSCLFPLKKQKDKKQKNKKQQYDEEMEKEAKIDYPLSAKITVTVLQLLFYISFFFFIFSSPIKNSSDILTTFLSNFSIGCLALFYIFIGIVFFYSSMSDVWSNKNELNKELLKELGFSSYDNITSIEIPRFYNGKDNVYKITSIGKNAFSDFKLLNNIIIPNSITKIEDYAFADSPALTELIIPEGVTEIGNNICMGCSNLTKLIIPDSVVKIKRDALYGLGDLKYLSIPKHLKNSIDNVVLNRIENVIYREFGEQKEIINKQIDNKKIKEDKSSISRKMLTISGDLIVIKKVKLKKEVPVKVKVNLKKEKKSIKQVSIKEQERNKYQECELCELNDRILKFLGYKNKLNIDSIDIPEIYISNNSFNYMKKKCAITSIKEGLFNNCKNLKKVIIPNSVSKIGREAFSGCTEIDNLKIPDSVTEIGENAFKDVNNVIYNGSAIGAPWGAKAINGMIL